MVRRLLWLIALAALAGCGRSCTSREAPGRLLADLSDVAGLAAIELGIEVPSQAETESSVNAIAERAHRLAVSGVEPMAAVSQVVFDELDFQREGDSDNPRFLLLPSVIDESRGNSVGLTQLFLVVGEQLGLDVHAALALDHVFVRHGNRNIEPCPGESPDELCREHHGTPEGVRAYLRPLSREETVAVLHLHIGNALRRRGDLARALSHDDQAIRRFDEWPEAHANRGEVLQLQGDLAGASRAYERARVLFPELPGLAESMAALARERERP